MDVKGRSLWKQRRWRLVPSVGVRDVSGGEACQSKLTTGNSAWRWRKIPMGWWG